MAYLEQSTRYVPYTDRPDGRWKYHVPGRARRLAAARAVHADAGPRLRDLRALDSGDGGALPREVSRRRRRTPTASIESVIRAKALDTLRGLLPAATTSNVGLFGTGQAYEALLLRMFAHPLEEVRDARARDAGELRQVIPAFLARVDQPDRGGRWIEYLRTRARRSRRRRARSSTASRRSRRDEVDAHRLRPGRRGQGRRGRAVLARDAARRPAAGDRAAAVGRRARGAAARLRRRPHQPPPQAGPRVRADALPLRRPRRLRRVPRSAAPPPADARVAAAQPGHGYVEPAAIEEAGALADWRAVMERSAALLRRARRRGGLATSRPTPSSWPTASASTWT